MKAAFEKHNNDWHQIKNASQKMYYLTYQIIESQSIIKHSDKWYSLFQSKNIVWWEVELLNNEIKRFNDKIIKEKWKNENDFDNTTITSIAVLDDTVIDNIDI